MKFHRNDPSLNESTQNRSLRYWRKQARDLFSSRHDINCVEVVRVKTGSDYLKRGETVPPDGVAVFVASSGGRWGRSRRNYYPVKAKN